MACCPFFWPSLVRTDSTRVQTLRTDPLELCKVKFKFKIIQPKKVVTQTCKDVVGFPPEPHLALHSSHLVLAVALKCNTIEVNPTGNGAAPLERDASIWGNPI